MTRILEQKQIARLMGALPPLPFYFTRHGETAWNAERRIQGQTDVPLSSAGLFQAETAADRLANIDLARIISSPLRRAADTARIIARNRSCPLLFRPALMERNFGVLTGMRIADVQQRFHLPSPIAVHDVAPEAGETFVEMAERYFAEIDGLLRVESQPLLIVGHGGLFRVLSMALHGSKSVCANAVPYLIRPESGTWSVVEIGKSSQEQR